MHIIAVSPGDATVRPSTIGLLANEVLKSRAVSVVIRPVECPQIGILGGDNAQTLISCFSSGVVNRAVSRGLKYL